MAEEEEEELDGDDDDEAYHTSSHEKDEKYIDKEFNERVKRMNETAELYKKL
jgi:hypothetical protein